MSLSQEQLAELTKRINARLDEFKASLWVTRGVVRVTHEVILEWWNEEQEQPVHATVPLSNGASSRQDSNGDHMLPPEGRQSINVTEQTRWDNHFVAGYTIEELAAMAKHAPDRDQFGDDDPNALADAWPDMPNLNGGVDHFAHHPVTGDEPPQTISRMPVVDTGMAHEPATAPAFSPQPDRPIGRERAPLPDPEQEQKRSHKRKPLTKGERRQSAYKGNPIPTREQVIAAIQGMAMGGVMPRQSAFNDAKPATWPGGNSMCQRLGTSWNELAQEAGLTYERRGQP